MKEHSNPIQKDLPALVGNMINEIAERNGAKVPKIFKKENLSKKEIMDFVNGTDQEVNEYFKEAEELFE